MSEKNLNSLLFNLLAGLLSMQCYFDFLRLSSVLLIYESSRFALVFAECCIISANIVNSTLRVYCMLIHVG